LCIKYIKSGLILEVLGSGGLEIYGRFMLRFEQSGTKLQDLEAVVLTHLHIDHLVDLPSYAKADYFPCRY